MDEQIQTSTQHKSIWTLIFAIPAYIVGCVGLLISGGSLYAYTLLYENDFLPAQRTPIALSIASIISILIVFWGIRTLIKNGKRGIGILVGITLGLAYVYKAYFILSVPNEEIPDTFFERELYRSENNGYSDTLKILEDKELNNILYKIRTDTGIYFTTENIAGKISTTTGGEIIFENETKRRPLFTADGDVQYTPISSNTDKRLIKAIVLSKPALTKILETYKVEQIYQNLEKMPYFRLGSTRDYKGGFGQYIVDFINQNSLIAVYACQQKNVDLCVKTLSTNIRLSQNVIDSQGSLTEITAGLYAYKNALYTLESIIDNKLVDTKELIPVKGIIIGGTLKSFRPNMTPDKKEERQKKFTEIWIPALKVEYELFNSRMRSPYLVGRKEISFEHNIYPFLDVSMTQKLVKIIFKDEMTQQWSCISQKIGYRYIDSQLPDCPSLHWLNKEGIPLNYNGVGITFLRRNMPYFKEMQKKIQKHLYEIQEIEERIISKIPQ